MARQAFYQEMQHVVERCGAVWQRALVACVVALALTCLGASPRAAGTIASPSAAAAVDPGSATVVGSVGGAGTLAVAIQGRYAYVGLGTLVVVVDFADRARPTNVGSAWLPGIPQAMALHDRWLYVAAGAAGLQVVDVGDPTRAHRATTFPSRDFAHGLALEGDHLFLADGSGGLVAVDVRDPIRPKEVDRHVPEGAGSRVVDVAVEAGYAYLADGSGVVRVVDVHDVGAMRQIGRVGDAPAPPRAIAVHDGTLYVLVGLVDRHYGNGMTDCGLWVVDATAPYAPFARGWAEYDGAAYDVVLLRDAALVAAGREGLVAFDVADPSRPRRWVQADFPGWTAALARGAGEEILVGDGQTGGASLWDFAVAGGAHELSRVPGWARCVVVVGDMAFAATASGLRALDISAPAAPREMSRLGLEGTAVDAVVAGDVLIAALQSPKRLVTIDVRDPRRMSVIAAVDLLATAQRVRLDGRIVYVATKGAVLGYDIADPRAPRQVSAFAPPESREIVDFDLRDSVAFLLLQTPGVVFSGAMEAWNVADPGHPGRLSSLGLGGWAARVVVEGSIAYATVACRQETADCGLVVIDVHDPVRPRIVASTPWVAGTMLALSDGLAYLTSGEVIDVARPEAMALVGRLNGLYTSPHASGQLYRVATRGRLALLSGATGDLVLVDMSDPRPPVLVGRWDPGDATHSARYVAADGRTAATSDEVAVDLVDMRLPYRPARAGHIDFPDVWAMSMDAGRLYVGSFTGSVFDVSNPDDPRRLAAIPFDADDGLVTAYAADGATLVAGTVNGGDEAALHVFHVADPSAPTRLADLPADRTWIDDVVIDGHIAHAVSQSGVFTLDLGRPERPVLTQGDWPRQLWGSSWPAGAAVHEHILFVVFRTSGLHSFDMSDPSAPRLLGDAGPRGTYADVAIQGDLAYVADRDAGVRVIDIGDPAAMKELGVIRAPGEAYGLAVTGPLLAVAGGQAGLVVVRLPWETGPLPTTNARWLPLAGRWLGE